MCLELYHLDAWRFYTTPGLTWNAGIKMTGVTLDLFIDGELYLFIEDGMRGCISVISQRYTKVQGMTRVRKIVKSYIQILLKI